MKRYIIRLLGKISYLLTIVLSTTNIVYPQLWDGPIHDWDRLEGVYVPAACWAHHTIKYNPENFLIEPMKPHSIEGGLSVQEMMKSGSPNDNATEEFKMFYSDLVKDPDNRMKLFGSGRGDFIINQYTKFHPINSLRYIPLTAGEEENYQDIKTRIGSSRYYNDPVYEAVGANSNGTKGITIEYAYRKLSILDLQGYLRHLDDYTKEVFLQSDYLKEANMVKYLKENHYSQIISPPMDFAMIRPGFKYDKHECQVYVIDFSKNVFYTIIDKDLSNIWIDRGNDYNHAVGNLINKKFKKGKKKIRFRDKRTQIDAMQHMQSKYPSPLMLEIKEWRDMVKYQGTEWVTVKRIKTSGRNSEIGKFTDVKVTPSNEHIDFIKSRGTDEIFTHNYFVKYRDLYEAMQKTYPEYLEDLFIRISSHLPPRFKGDGTVSSYDILSKIKIQSTDSFNYGLVDTSHVLAMNGILQSSIPLFSDEVYKKDSTTDLKLTKLFDKNSVDNVLDKIIGLEFNLHDYLKNNKDKIIQEVLPSVSDIKYAEKGDYYILPKKYSEIFTNNLIEQLELDKPTKTVRQRVSTATASERKSIAQLEAMGNYSSAIEAQAQLSRMAEIEVPTDITIRGNKTLDKLVNGFYSGVGGNMSSADRWGLKGKLIGPLKQVGVDEERFGGRKQYHQWFSPEDALGTREWYTKDEVIKYFGSELKAIENDIVPEDSVFFRQNHWVKKITLLYGKKGIIETINVDNLKNRNEEGFPNRKETKPTQLEITWDVRWNIHNGVFDKKNPRYGQTNNWFVINIKSLNKKIYFLATSMGLGGRYYGWDALKGNSSSDLGMRIPEKNISLFDKLRKSYNTSVEKTPISERKVTYLSNLIDKEIEADNKRTFQILLRISQSGNSSYTMKTIALPNMNNYPKLGVPENRVLYSPFTPYSDDTEYIIDLDKHIIETDLMIDIYGMVIAR